MTPDPAYVAFRDGIDAEMADEIARLQTALAAQTVVVEAAQALIAGPVCQRGFQSFGHEKCTQSGEPCDLHYWHMLKHALTVLGAIPTEKPS